MKNIYGALRVGTWRVGLKQTFYVYYEDASLVKSENIIKSGFNTKEEANKWIDNVA